MQVIDKSILKKAIKDVYIRCITEIPLDVLDALKKAREHETNTRAQEYLDILIKNAIIAKKNKSVICQDTGVPTFFIKTSLGFPYYDDLHEAFEECIRELTLQEFPMRAMIVHPVTRVDRCDNTGKNVPILHVEIEPNLNYMEIKAVPKGAGSGIWGTLKFFPPSVGISGVKKYVIDSVINAGSNPCPPLIVGVGLGGTIEEVSRLATVASARPVNQRHPEPEIEALENELYEALNMSQIGPMGMGGDTTVLAVNVEYSATHKPWLPVAVNINCWPGRRAVCRIYNDGHIEQIEGGK